MDGFSTRMSGSAKMKIAKQEQLQIGGSGAGYTTGVPATLYYMHNTEPAPKMYNGEFGTDIEPHGRYLTERDSADIHVQSKYEYGSVSFRRPLVLPFGGMYRDPTNWKCVLSAHYGGKKGRSLSNAVVKDGYDGIITYDEYGSSEIVDITSLR
jgi:hypothetical protein